MEIITKNYEWIFSGIGVLVLGYFFSFLYKKFTNAEKNLINEPSNFVKAEMNPTISPVNTVNINIGKGEDDNAFENKVTEESINRNAKIDSLKPKVKILFIDDDKKFNIVKILKDSGWKNTLSITDIKSVDTPNVKEADILFVDVNGVGKLLNCEHEGLDVALMLKQKYPDKRIIIYSANNKNNNFHPAWDACDFKLEKNALSYQFQSLVEQYSLELYG